jgi:hypothetical protein
MSTTRFHLISQLSPAEGVAVLTDFGPRRPDTWPGIDAEHFTIHDRGDNWAEITEGNASAWERARYDWNATDNRVDITTRHSKLFGEGGGWTFIFTPTESGSRIDVELIRTPASFRGKVLAALLPLIGAPALKKAFRGPFQTA